MNKIILHSKDGTSEEYSAINNVKHGTYSSYYTNGQINILCEYADGILHGKYSSRYSNGIVKIKCTYDCGRLEGKMTSFYEDGKPFEEYLYNRGLVMKVISIKDKKARETVLPPGRAIVWKACQSNTINVYVKLLLDEKTRRITPKLDKNNGNVVYKSRVSSARVLEIMDSEGRNYTECESSIHLYTKVKYVVRDIAIPDGFNDNLEEECGQGISVHAYRDECNIWF